MIWLLIIAIIEIVKGIIKLVLFIKERKQARNEKQKY